LVLQSGLGSWIEIKQSIGIGNDVTRCARESNGIRRDASGAGHRLYAETLCKDGQAACAAGVAPAAQFTAFALNKARGDVQSGNTFICASTFLPLSNSIWCNRA